jgi:hypothetical protein
MWIVVAVVAAALIALSLLVPGRRPRADKGPAPIVPPASEGPWFPHD